MKSNIINRSAKLRQNERIRNNYVTRKSLFGKGYYITKPTGNNRSVARYNAGKLCRKLWLREAEREAELRYWDVYNRI